MTEISVSGKKVDFPVSAPTATSTPFQRPKQRKIVTALKQLPTLARMDSTGSLSSTGSEMSASEEDIDQTLTPVKSATETLTPSTPK